MRMQTFPELMRVFLAVTLASQAAGNALNWGPDRAKADRGTRSIFSLVDRTPLVDAASPAGEKPAVAARGALEFRDVVFRYPTRPDGPPALNKLSLVVRPGQKVALVGESHTSTEHTR